MTEARLILCSFKYWAMLKLQNSPCKCTACNCILTSFQHNFCCGLFTIITSLFVFLCHDTDCCPQALKTKNFSPSISSSSSASICIQIYCFPAHMWCPILLEVEADEKKGRFSVVQYHASCLWHWSCGHPCVSLHWWVLLLFLLCTVHIMLNNDGPCYSHIWNKWKCRFHFLKAVLVKQSQMKLTQIESQWLISGSCHVIVSIGQFWIIKLCAMEYLFGYELWTTPYS